MVKVQKYSLIICISIIMVFLIACNTKESESVSDFSATMTVTETDENTENVDEEEVAEEETEAETEADDGNTNYYTDLLVTDARNKQNAKEKQASDLALAELLLKECTKKLSNCTVELDALTKYNCGDIDKQVYKGKTTPTNAEYKVTTLLRFDTNATQLTCKQDKMLYRDNNLIDTYFLMLTTQATAVDNWSDKMNFLMFYNIGMGNSTITNEPIATIKDELSKGEVYNYISKDVRSCLNRFLSIDIESLEEEDNTYIIKGKTKAIFVIVDEIGGNAIRNNETWVNADGQKNAGLMNTTGILVKHNNDITLYIDKETETLTAIEATSKNELNHEETEMKGVVKDVGTTEIEPIALPEDLATIAISEINKVNADVIYSR